MEMRQFRQNTLKYRKNVFTLTWGVFLGNAKTE